MLVTLGGIVMLERDVHAENMPNAISVTPGGIVTLVSEEQPENA